MSQQKNMKRAAPSRGLGAAKKKISQENKENIDPSLVSNEVVVNNVINTRQLILEQRYPLNVDQWITIGFDPLKNFNVVVRLMNSQRSNDIQFDVTEFEDLIKSQDIILNNLLEVPEFNQLVLGYVHIQGTRTVTIEKNNVTLRFDICTLQKMYKMYSILHYYITFLKSLNFSQLFHDAITNSFSIQTNVDILTLLNQMTNIEGGIHFLGIKEILYFYPEIFYNALVNVAIA